MIIPLNNFQFALTFSLTLVFVSFVFTDQNIKRAKTCTSSRFECSFNISKESTIYFSDISGAKPYNKICRYGGRLYQLGWNIAIPEEPCVLCVCDERWDDTNPLESLSCHRIDCEPDLQTKLKAGCRPLYSSDKCCPVDYYCRQQCVFNGTRYAIGTKLYVKSLAKQPEEPNLCDECECRAPPHFTCSTDVCSQRISDKLVLLQTFN